MSSVALRTSWRWLVSYRQRLASFDEVERRFADRSDLAPRMARTRLVDARTRSLRTSGRKSPNTRSSRARLRPTDNEQSSGGGLDDAASLASPGRAGDPASWVDGNRRGNIMNWRRYGSPRGRAPNIDGGNDPAAHEPGFSSDDPKHARSIRSIRPSHDATRKSCRRTNVWMCSGPLGEATR